MAKQKSKQKAEESAEEERTSGRSFWSGTITFGLVSIPVDFFSATRPRQARLRMVTGDGDAVGRRYICPRHDRPVPNEELVRGFELDSGEFVPIAEKELASARPEKTRDIDLRRFVPLDDLPRLFFVRPYVLAPSGSSTKAYRLLAETMERTKKVGIATMVMRDKAYIVAIMARSGLLLAETLRFASEVRTPEMVGLPARKTGSAASVKTFLTAIDDLTEPELRREELADEYGEALTRLAEGKAKRRQGVLEIEATPEPESEEELPPPIDLMALLKERLEGGGNKAQRSANSPASSSRASTREASSRAPSASALAEKPKEALYQRAKKLGIEGRSRMTKGDLVKAIHKAAS
jgi:DNA end-binding protein Ku